MSDDNHDRSIFFLWSINYPENQPVPCLIPIWGCRHIRTRSLGRSIIDIMCHHMPSVTLKNDRHLPFAWATDFFQRISTMRRFTTSADPFSLMNTLGPNLPVSLKKKIQSMLGTLVYPWKLRKSQLSRHKAEKLRRTTDKWSEWEFGLYGLAPLSPPPPPPLHCYRFPQQKSESMKWIGVRLIL